MKFRPNRFHNLLNDDWHTQLLNALRIAREATCSQELQSDILRLEQKLGEVDECNHTATAILPTSKYFSGIFLLPFIQKCCDVVPSTAFLKSDGSIEVTITARGSRHHVQKMAETILTAGISAARHQLQLEDLLRNTAPAQN